MFFFLKSIMGLDVRHASISVKYAFNVVLSIKKDLKKKPFKNK